MNFRIACKPEVEGVAFSCLDRIDLVIEMLAIRRQHEHIGVDRYDLFVDLVMWPILECELAPRELII